VSAVAVAAAPAGARRHTTAAPVPPIRASLTVPVDAGADAVRAALERVDLRALPWRALQALDLAERAVLAPAGAGEHAVRILAGLGGGHVEARWDVTVAADGDDRCTVTVATRLAPSDAAVRGRLLDAWCVVGAACEAIARRTARLVAGVAEDGAGA
jgi:hypothetical protein